MEGDFAIVPIRKLSSMEAMSSLSRAWRFFRMSELIEKYASDYINMGDNTEERQSFLNGACTAWNVALLPEHMREEALRRRIEEYKRINPGVDDAEQLKQMLTKASI